MANEEHLKVLRQGVEAWNAWRKNNLEIKPDLTGENLSGVDLRGFDLGSADLSETKLKAANLARANLSGATLFRATLSSAFLSGAYERDQHHGKWGWCEGAQLPRANLKEAELVGAHLAGADFTEADLTGANLCSANLHQTNLSWARLAEAYLGRAVLVETNLKNADLTSCRVYGISAWNLNLEGAKQKDLIITRTDEPKITVDNLKVAQFIYLLLNNEEIRDVIDTITSKAVLILGRFTPERKAVLDVLREELRKHDYLPILFDFDVPANRDITETVSLLARMARFIVADLTEPSSIPKELEAIVPDLAVPVQPLLEGSTRPYAMFKDYWKYDWVLPVYRYEGLQTLLATLAGKVVAPAEAKVKALEEKRRAIEAKLTKVD